LLDASSTAATTQLTISDDVANTAGAGGNMVTGDGGFETSYFRGFTNITVRGGGGAAETITLASLDLASTETSITLDGDDLTNTDASADTIIVQSLPATVIATLLGGAGNDLFLLDSNGLASGGTVDNILGQVIVSPAGDEGGTDTLTLTDDSDASGDTISLSTTQIDGITGFGGIDVVYTNVDTVNLNTGSGDDTLNISATLTGVLYNLNTQGGGDTINVSSNAPLLTGTLDNIDGQINLSTGLGIDTLNVSDAGDAVADSYAVQVSGAATFLQFNDGAAPVDLRYDAAGGAGQLEFFNLIASDTGGDLLQILNTTATTATVVHAGGGDDNIIIHAAGMSAANTFNGHAGNDAFQVILPLGQTITAGSFAINGNDPASDTLPNQDIVVLTAAGARAVGLTYQSAGSGDVNVTGLGTVIDVNTCELLQYQGDAANDDTLTVTGVAGVDDDLSVIPTGSASAQVFRGGDPFDGPPESPSINRPGSLSGPGASFGPDLNLFGASSLTLHGGTAGAQGNRLYVYGSSESPLANSNGVIYVPGLADARDVINVTDSQVTINNGTLGALLPVNINTASFVQTVPMRRALIVNGGDETLAGPGGVADDITVTLSSLLSIQINGGNPLPALAPNGDQLHVITPGDVNVYSDKNSPPNVTIGSAGTLDLGFSSIERTLITPGSGVVNLIGDNNQAVGQKDHFVVVGADVDGNPLDGGVGEFVLNINGSAPISFDGVQLLNVLGEEEVDTLELTPYADNTPRGWGMQVLFDEGNPPGAIGNQVDLLVYHTVAAHAVSENIIVQPSGPEAGELRVTNATDGSAIVTVSYINNLDVIVNDNDLFASDTDTLVLRGIDQPGPVSGDSFDIDLTAAGAFDSPLVTVTDTGTPLYRLRAFTGFDNLRIETLGGTDFINVRAGRNDGSVTLYVDGGEPDAAGFPDMLSVYGTANAGDFASILPGASDGSGLLSVQRSTAGIPTAISYQGIGQLGIGGGGGGGADQVEVNGTPAGDEFTLTATSPLAGLLSVNTGPTVLLVALGSAGSTITLAGGDGPDVFDLRHVDNWQIGSVVASNTASGGGSQVRLTGASLHNDDFDFIPFSVSGAHVLLTSGGSTTTYKLSGAAAVTIDGDSQTTADTLTVATSGATLVPGPNPGEGQVLPVNAVGTALLPLSYRKIETTTLSGGAVVVEGTSANDTITVSAAGIVTVTNLLGFNSSIDLSGFNSLIINALGGDDAISIAASTLFTGGIRVVGGEPGAGSDSLTVTGTAGNDNIVVDLATLQVTGVVGGLISLDGIEHLTVNGGGAAAGDNIDINNFGSLNSLSTIQVNANNLADTLDVTGTSAADVINFSATSAAAGLITRNGTPTTIRFGNLSGAKTILGGAGGFDVLNVLGAEGPDAATTTATTVTLTGTVTIGAGIDQLMINTLGGSDNVTLSGLTLPTIVDAGAGHDVVNASALTVDVALLGGSGNDTLTGGSAGDRIEGGGGNDTLSGGAGNDLLLGGDDFDVIDPGAGIDDVEGGAGSDDWLVITTDAAAINLRESAGRFRVEHGGHVVLGSDISQALFTATTAATIMTVLDLSGTSVDRVGVDFNDGGTASTLVVEGTPAADDIGLGLAVTNPGGDMQPHVTLGWGSVVAGAISAAQGDRIVVRSLGGDDSIVAAQNVMDGSGAASALVTLDGGNDNDAITAHTPANQSGNILIGGLGRDVLFGGVGNDQLDGQSGDDTFAGNGGSDTLLGTTGNDTILVADTAGNDDITLTLSAVGDLLVTVNGLITTYLASLFADVERVSVPAGEGTDSLTIDSANGAIGFLQGIEYDGGTGSDSLTLTGGTAASNIYSVGPNPGQGTSAIEIGGVTQLVTFSGLEPVIDLVAGPLEVNATSADNAINYSQGSLDDRRLVTIDHFESIEFSNKSTLTIHAGAGNDTIHLNSLVTPTSLTSIVVNAGDPTDDDQLLVNGVAGVADSFLVTPSAAGSGTISKLAGPQPSVTFSGLESLAMVGQAADLDALQYAGTAGNDTLTYTPGATADSGAITGFASTVAPFAFVATTFAGIRGSLFLGSGGGNGTVGGSDTVVLNGSAADDVFSAPAGVLASPSVTVDTGANPHTPVLFNADGGTSAVVLRGLAGNDRFDLDFNPLLASAGVTIRTEGGDGNDTINHTANTDAVTTIDLAADSISSTGANLVTFSGVETINQVASGAAAALSVLGTGNDDQFQYTPASATGGTVLLASTGLAVSFSGVSGTFGLSGAGGSDTVTVLGSAAANAIAVSGTQVTVDALKTVNIAAESLHVLGLAGADTFHVTPGAMPIFIDGGDPIGALPGDQLNIVSGGGAVNYHAGPENDEGSIVVGGTQPISFDKIESIGPIFGSPSATINGTGGDDAITIIARDESYITPPDPVPAGLDGAQDFTVQVNDGPTLLFINTPVIVVDAMGGSDEIAVQTPAPNLAAWDVDISIDGGLPTGSDTVIFGTPGAADTVQYTPTGADTGTLNIVNLMSLTNLVGIEHLIYDGEGGNDLFSIIGTSSDDTMVHTPGSAADEGALRVNNLLAVSYQNLGLATTVNVDGGLGTDTLVYQGTDANDQFTVNGSAIDLVTNLANHLDLIQTSVESLLLNGFGGDDSFTVNATGQYTGGVGIHGGEPSGSDSATLAGTAGIDAIALTLGAAADSVTGVVAGPLSLVGVENLTVNSLAGDDALSVANLGDPTDLNLITLNSGSDVSDSVTLVGGAGPDAIVVTPLSVTSVSATAGIGPTITVNLAAAATSTFTVAGGSGSDSVSVNGTSDDDVIAVARGATTNVLVGGNKQVSIASATTEALTVAAGLGSDTINVSGIGGLALSVHGGQPDVGDLLTITNTAAGTTTVSPGATVDAGVVTTPDGVVAFEAVESINVIGNGAVDTLTTQGTNGPDQIALQFLGGGNRVWVDGRTVISFSGFGTVNLQGRFGDDKFSVAPVGLVGVTAINVSGGDPTASDELVVTGKSATEAIAFTPSGVDAGTVVIGGAPVVNFTTTESLVIDAAGGNDTLTVNAPATLDTIHVKAGATIDAGSVQVNALIAASFKNLGATGVLSIIDAGGSDTLVYDGTTANDQFTVNGAVIDLVTQLINNHFDVSQSGVESLVLNAFDGDDQFTINATTLYSGGITIWAGDPSASDSVTLVGTAAANAINVVLGASGDVVTGVVGGPINLVDVENLTINSLGGNDPLSLTNLGGTSDLDNIIVHSGGDALDTLLITATTSADSITVQPTSATSATLSANGVGPLVTANLGAAASSLLSVVGGGGSDDLVVEGSANADVIAVSGMSVEITGLKTVGFSDFAALTVRGQQGNDAFTVTPSATLPIFIDGGDPIGVNLSGDSLALVTNGSPIAYFAGPESDEGGFLIGANAEVSFDHIETIGPIVVGPGPGPVLIVGTNGDDDITIIARDNSTHPILNTFGPGVQDFTVSVNQGPDILFINGPALYVDPLSGDDDVVVRAPAPNDMAWRVTVNVVGGSPSASDTLVLETPGNDTVIYTPTGSDTGVLRLDEAPLGPVADANDSIINILPLFTIPFPRLTYVSSPGGIEHLKYDGEGSADTLRIVGTIDSDIIVHTPGLAVDEGTLRVNSLLELSYQNLGLAAAIVVDGGALGSDRLVYDGTDGNDSFTVVASGAIDLTNHVGNHVDVSTSSIEALTLNALNGDDSFTINGALVNYSGGIIVAAGDPSGSDIATLNGAVGVDAMTLSLGAAGDLVTGVVGGLINLVGVENLTINSLAGDDVVTVNNVGTPSDLDFVTLNLGSESNDQLTVNGTDNDDRIVYTPTSTAGGTFGSESGPTLFSFTQGVAATSTFTINALAAGGDVVAVQGTNNHDVITVNSPVRTVTVENSAGLILKPVILGITVESVTAEGRLGNDTFHVIPSRRQPLAPVDVPVGPGFTLPTNLLVNIDGGGPGASDALVIAGVGGATLASDLFVVVNRGRESDEGVVRIFQDQPGPGNEPFQFPDISYTDVELVSPVPFVNAAGDPNLLILGADLYEQNEFRANAAFLGSGSAVNVVNVSIFPNAFEHRFVQSDQDCFRVVAQQTGTLDFQVYFRQLNEFLPGRGNLQIQVLDADGTVIAGSGPNFGTNDGPGDFSVDDERIRIPVVAGQTYYLRAFGLVDATVNAYSIAITNQTPPVPFDIELDDFVATSSVTTGISASQFNGGAGLSDIDGYYNGKFLTFTSGPLTGQRALITSYTAATRTFVFAAAWFSAAPLVGASFLVESGDTGRSQFENTTRDNTPTIFLRLDDAIFLSDLPGNGAPGTPPDEVIPIPFNASTDFDSTTPGFRIAVYDETNTHNPVPMGFAQPVPAQPGVYMFTFPDGAALVDGSHFISARVQIIDPASPTQRGFGGRSLSAEIVIDTGVPPIYFGSPINTTDGLDPSSDMGVPGFPHTFVDRITSDTTPSLFGMAEANSIVRVYADRNANGVVDLGDVFLGQSVAVPLDGANQLPGGQWNLTSIVDLNNPAFFPKDGTRRLLATAEDLAGNVTAATSLKIFIDTQGPQVTNVSIPSDPFFDLFDPKPSQDGATPLVFSLAIDLRDLPNRDTINFPGYLALIEQVAEQPGHYVVRGDKVGVIAVQSVEVKFGPDINGSPATATIVLTFAAPLPDDRYTLTISDTITDPANNKLDGENNAIQPLEASDFPSGDGTPGGAFAARFTVDSRPEIGTYAGTQVYLDTNGNFLFDPTGINNDAVNHDIVHVFGSTSDQVFAGKFGPPPLTGRFFDQLAAYGQFGGTFRWLVDLNSDGVVDISTIQATAINGVALAGNFDLNPFNGDEIGLFDGSNWYRDLNRNFVIEPGEGRISSTMQGYPIVGDFDGDGRDDLGTFNNNVFYFDLAANGLSGNADATVAFGFPGVSERPVAADMDQDGIDDIGLWVPGSLGQTDAQTTEWHFLVSNDRTPGDGINDRVIGTVNTLNHAFTPVPFGADLFAQFGDQPAFPVVGNFDPPVAAPSVQAGSNDIVVVASGPGSSPRVRVLDHETGQEKLNFLAYGATFTGGVKVATGDVNDDGVLDIITAAGPGGGPHVRVFDGASGAPLGGTIGSFYAYSPAFTGGVNVASADINGDGKADIITAAGAGGGPHVRIFSGADGSLLGEYFAFNPAFTGGVNVAAGDVNGDTIPDVVAAAGPGGGPHVRVFSGASTQQIAGPLGSFFAYSPAFSGGVFVAAGDINGDTRADIVTGAGAGGGPHVIAFNAATGSPLSSFFAYDPAFSGGVRVATADLNRDGRDDIITGAGASGGPHLRGFGGLTSQLVLDTFAFEAGFTGGLFVAGAPSSIGGASLHAAAGAVEFPGESISDAQLQRLVAAAIGRWQQSGLSQVHVDRLRGIDVHLADLPGSHLGISYDDAIFIDSNAAGYGWFVDATPEQDEEFSGATPGLATTGQAQHRMDLLSALVHEFGHVLGLDDLDGEVDPRQVMADELAAGMRRVLSADRVDDAFASGDWQ
jgi:Ca2+-binding RTX toxin-like protein